MLKYCFFDLDGTLLNTERGVTTSVAYSLAAFGITEEPKNLKHFIGPPLYDSYEKYYGFTREQAIAAVDKFRERYSVTGKFENDRYEGMEECLDDLVKAGYKLYIVTSKAEKFAREIAERFGLAKYFLHIAGASQDGSRVEKVDVINYLIESEKIVDPENAVMIGDRIYDTEGARQAGIRSVYVLWGFGSAEEAKSCRADFIAATPQELKEIITSL